MTREEKNLRDTKVGRLIRRNSKVHRFAHKTWCRAFAGRRIGSTNVTSGGGGITEQQGSLTVNVNVPTIPIQIQYLNGQVLYSHTGSAYFPNVPDGTWNIVLPSTDPASGDTFISWSDGLVTPTRTVIVTFGSAQTFSASYNITTPPVQEGDVTIASNVPITVSIADGSGTIASGATPYTVTLTSGVQYNVTVPTNPASNETFSGWADGVTTPSRAFSVSIGGHLTLTAMYQQTTTPPPSGGTAGTIQFAYFDISQGGASTFINAKTAYPSVPMIVVINPSNGPLPVTLAYQNVVQQLHAAGIQVYGYVDTCIEQGGSCSNNPLPLSTITGPNAGITGYNGYGLDGIFFDNTNAWPVSLYAGMQQQCAALGLKSIGNAGAPLQGTSYLSYLDYWIISENPTFPSPVNYTQPTNTSGLNPAEFMLIGYGYTSGFPSSAISAVVPSKVGWINVSQSSVEYQSATKVYLTQTMALLSSINSGGGTIPPSGNGTINVNTIDQNGNALTGYYVGIYNDAALTSLVTSQFSPASFSLPAGTYYVDPEDFTCTFTNWSVGASGSTRPLPVANLAGGLLNLTAQYLCGSSGGGSGGTTALGVFSWDTNGNPLTGLDVFLYDSSQSQINSAYTPAYFGLANGVSYYVSPSDFGNYTFAYWYDNQSATRLRKVTGGVDTQLIAVYNVV